MEKIRLGNTEIHSAPIILGGNVFGWTLDEKESFYILDRFMEAGFNTIDTANVYSRWIDGNEGGESETIIGKWMSERNNRDKVNIITKVGMKMGENEEGLSKDYILRAADESLQRLQTSYIDVYLSHKDDENTPVEETLSAYDKLIKHGKVREIGASNFSAERLDESFVASEQKGLPRYEIMQPEYNLYDRADFEEKIGPACHKHGMGVISYFSLASGFLTGKYRSEEDFDKSDRGKKMDKYLNERGKNILSALDDLSEKHDTTQAAISLAWLIQNPHVSAPIASATKDHHIKAFIDAVEVHLSQSDMEALNAASEVSMKVD